MNLSGVLAPIPTPFDESDSVDTKRLRALLDGLMSRPLTGIVVLGSNGEAALVDDFEADRVIVAARDHVPRDRPFIVGTGRESTQATIRASRRAAEHGADAVLVRTPGFFKSQMTTDVFVRHYTAVADQTPVPVLLYNFTAVTGVNLLPAAVSRLAEHPNIIGVKESGGDIAQVADLVAGTPPEFKVLAGSGVTFYAALCAGAAGAILAIANVIPEACVRVFDLVRDGHYDEARALQRKLVPFARLLGQAYGVAGLKAAMGVVGYDIGRVRPPLNGVSDVALAQIREALSGLETRKAIPV